MTFDIAAVRARLAEITRGPWSYDVTHNEGSYGSGGDDEREGFSSYQVLAEKRAVRGGELVVEEGVVCDCVNSDFIEVQEEHGDDEDGGTAWDEQGKKNAQFIAAAPADLAAACDVISTMLEALNAAEARLEELGESALSAECGAAMRGVKQ